MANPTDGKPNNFTEGFQELIRNGFKPGAALHERTGKTSAKDLTLEECQTLFKDFPGFAAALVNLIDLDRPQVTAEFVPNGVTVNELHRLALAQLAKDDRINMVFGSLKAPPLSEEAKREFIVNGKPYSLHISEAFALELNTAMRATDNTPLNARQEGMRKRNDALSDVAAFTSGYTVGSLATLNPRLNPGNPDITIPNGAQTPAQAQGEYCNTASKIYDEGRALDNADAYKFGFQQARMDTSKNFDVVNVAPGLTAPCPPAATPSTGIANGNGTSSVNQPGGGGGNPLAAPSAKGR